MESVQSFPAAEDEANIKQAVVYPRPPRFLTSATLTQRGDSNLQGSAGSNRASPGAVKIEQKDE